MRYMETLAAARETVTKILARRSHTVTVNVTAQGGNTASVWRQGDFVTLNLPSLAADTIVTQGEADRFTAFIGHEMCHVLHTDWTVNPRQLPRRVMAWANALEDIRIEAKELKEGPFGGLKGFIESLCLATYADAVTQLAAQGQVLGTDVVNAPYTLTLLGRMANGYSIPTANGLAAQLSPEVRRLTDFALAGLRQCQNTRDCVALAEKLVAMEGAGQNGQGQGQGQASQKAQDGQSQGQGQDKGQSQETSENASGEPVDGQDGEGEGAGESGEGEPKSESAKDGGKDGQEGGKPANGAGGKGGKQQEISAEISLTETAKTLAKQPGAKSGAAIALNDATAKHRKGKTHPHGGAAILDARMPVASVLHGQIARLLVSEERNQRTHHETSGRLDRRALTRMRVGAGDVFSRRDYMPGQDTAIMLLVDCSGSMGNENRMTTAQTAAWVIAKAADAAGGKCAIAGFTGAGEVATLTVVKDFGQTAHTAADGIMCLHASSSTPLSASILGAAKDLANVQATRRILMVLTDGMCDLGPDAVQAACRIAADMGVETVGVGINCENVTAAFPPKYSVNVQNVRQLATTGLGALVTMLEDAAGEGWTMAA